MSWFCENCNAVVPDRHVTYTEEHDTRYGGCGGDVTSLEAPVKPRQPDERDAEIARLREELAAANKRAEKAEGPLQDILFDHAVYCGALKHDLAYETRRAELAEQREREALAMLLKCEEHSGVADANFGPTKSHELVKTPALVDMLTRAREQSQEVDRG